MRRPGTGYGPAWRGVLAVLLLVLATPAGLGAQERVVQSTVRGNRNTQLRELNTQLGEVARLLRNDPEQAMLLLRRLRSKHPREVRVLTNLGQAYQALGKIDSAMVMYRQCLAFNQTNHEAIRALGILHYARGDREKAEDLFQRFLKDSRHNVGAYRLVGATLVEVGRYDLALDIYHKGSKRSEQHYKLKLNIADLEKTLGNYQTALTEYLNYIEQVPGGYRPIKKIVGQMFEGLGSSVEGQQEGAKLLAIIEQRAAQTKTARSEMLDLLAGIYLGRGLLESSLDAALESDRAKRTNGQALFLFTEKLWNGYLDNQGEARRRYYDLCLRALAAYVEQYPRALLAPKAAYRRAYLFADAARGIVAPDPGPEPADPYADAIDQLDEMITRYPGSVEAAQAVLVKGDLLFEVGRRPREALAVYNEGLKRSSQVTSAFVEKIGRMYLVLEEYDSARRHFDKFIRSSHEQRQQAGIYYLGVLMSFTGEYEAARDTLTSLAKIDPSSPYTNDAIELAWVIEEGMQKNKKALGYYINALKADMARDTARVVSSLERIVAEGAGSSLRPRALYRLGGVYAQQKNYEKALDRLQQFAGEYSDHHLRPDVHRAIARVYEYGLGRTDLALKEYQTILIKHPSYIFIDEVRMDITRLEPGER